MCGIWGKEWGTKQNQTIKKNKIFSCETVTQSIATEKLWELEEKQVETRKLPADRSPSLMFTFPSPTVPSIFAMCSS